MIDTLRVSFGKWIEGRTETPAGERYWERPNLPEREEFVAALENILFSVEAPFLVSPARVEMQTWSKTYTLEVDQWETEEELAATIWAWAVSTSQGLT